MLFGKFFRKEKIRTEEEVLGSLPIISVSDWVNSENAYEAMNEHCKNVIPKIGTSLNRAIRNGLQKNCKEFEHLFQNSILKNDVVLYRGVESMNYEHKLATEKGLASNTLYHDGYVYCSLNPTDHIRGAVQYIIHVPAGTHYACTGKYSNNPERNEVVLPIGTIFKIQKTEKAIRASGDEMLFVWVTVV